MNIKNKLKNWEAIVLYTIPKLVNKYETDPLAVLILLWYFHVSTSVQKNCTICIIKWEIPFLSSIFKQIIITARIC